LRRSQREMPSGTNVGMGDTCASKIERADQRGGGMAFPGLSVFRSRAQLPVRLSHFPEDRSRGWRHKDFHRVRKSSPSAVTVLRRSLLFPRSSKGEQSALYQVPSGSKSSSSGCATGLACWKALRSAIRVQVPSLLTLIIPFGTFGTPWEQPAPANNAYRVLPTKATSATPLIRGLGTGWVWLEGRFSTTEVTTPAGLIFTMLAVIPPV
jgi:hypothetical protein